MKNGNSKNSHYHEIECYDDISKNMLNKIHRIVDIVKSMCRGNMIETYGRTMNFTFALKRGKIIEMAWCDYRRVIYVVPKLGVTYYNPLEHKESTYKPCLHSEMACLSKLKSKVDINDFSNFELVNIRVNRTDKLNCVVSAPCDNCRSAMSILNVRKCYFYDGNKWKYIKF